MRKAAFGLVFFLLIACGGSPEPDETGEGSGAASGGEDPSVGGSGQGESGGTGGGSGTAGASTGGLATGGSSNGGSSQGGSELGGMTSAGGDSGEAGADSGAVGGTAGSVGGTGGTETAGAAGATGGSGGSASTDPVCDPSDGELDNTPYPSCKPRIAGDVCELCIEARCCEESKVCYGFEPGNVCGWGGPTAGVYGRMSEIDCYLECAREYVSETGVYDDNAADLCVPACTTAECGLIGSATQDLVVCLEANCDEECFGP